MASKVFLDANILLDLTLQREHYTVAKKIFQISADGDLQLFITPAIVHIVAYWLTKAYNRQVCKELILAILADVTVIDATHELTVNAVYSKIDDIEDALQYFTALHHKLDFFLTRDKALKKAGIPALPIYTPEDFLKEFYAR